jgi:uncharacterized protein YdeI (YjbR/CyaY-like superfamily)
VEAARGDAGLSGPEPIFFKSTQEFYDWLEEHHESESEVYVGMYKKHTGKRAMSWSEAVDQALCFGWIDGRANSIDEDSYMQRFTPRRPGSNWSKINIAKVAKLTEEGRMRPAGLRAFEARKEAGTDSYSYEQRHEIELTPEFERRLRANAAAWEDWHARPPSYRTGATYWVMSAKREETRERRLAKLIECSAEGRTVPPLTPPPRKR